MFFSLGPHKAVSIWGGANAPGIHFADSGGWLPGQTLHIFPEPINRKGNAVMWSAVSSGQVRFLTRSLYYKERRYLSKNKDISSLCFPDICCCSSVLSSPPTCVCTRMLWKGKSLLCAYEVEITFQCCFTNRDVINWMFSAIKKSTECGESKETAGEKDEHIRWIWKKTDL